MSQTPSRESEQYKKRRSRRRTPWRVYRNTLETITDEWNGRIRRALEFRRSNRPNLGRTACRGRNSGLYNRRREDDARRGVTCTGAAMAVGGPWGAEPDREQSRIQGTAIAFALARGLRQLNRRYHGAGTEGSAVPRPLVACNDRRVERTGRRLASLEIPRRRRWSRTVVWRWRRSSGVAPRRPRRRRAGRVAVREVPQETTQETTQKETENDRHESVVSLDQARRHA